MHILLFLRGSDRMVFDQALAVVKLLIQTFLEKFGAVKGA